MLLAYFIIDATYNNKMYGQSYEKCAHVQWAFPDFLSFRALAGPAIKALIISCYQHSPFKVKEQSLSADSEAKIQIRFLFICLETLLPKQTKKFIGFSFHIFQNPLYLL